MIHDPFLNITAEDLRAVMASRRKRGLPEIYPASAPEIGQLTTDGRIWWVAESIQVALISRRLNRPDDEQAWRDRAGRIADAIAPEISRMPRLLRQLADALDGIPPEPPASPWTRAESRAVAALLEFRRASGRYPSQRGLITFAAKHGVKLSKRCVSDVYRKMPFPLPAERAPG